MTNRQRNSLIQNPLEMLRAKYLYDAWQWNSMFFFQIGALVSILYAVQYCDWGGDEKNMNREIHLIECVPFNFGRADEMKWSVCECAKRLMVEQNECQLRYTPFSTIRNWACEHQNAWRTLNASSWLRVAALISSSTFAFLLESKKMNKCLIRDEYLGYVFGNLSVAFSIWCVHSRNDMLKVSSGFPVPMQVHNATCKSLHVTYPAKHIFSWPVERKSFMKDRHWQLWSISVRCVTRYGGTLEAGCKYVCFRLQAYTILEGVAVYCVSLELAGILSGTRLKHKVDISLTYSSIFPTNSSGFCISHTYIVFFRTLECCRFGGHYIRRYADARQQQ